MFKNYIKIAFRNILKYKVYSFINIFGLSIGMASAILVILWVTNELSYDDFNLNNDNIYRVTMEREQGGTNVHNAKTSAALSSAIVDKFPEILKSARLLDIPVGWSTKSGENQFRNDRIMTSDPDFFNMFTYPFVKGDAKKPFKSNPFGMVISEDMAIKHFGTEDPIGKIITMEVNDFEVTGVIKNVPKNSHIQFDCVIPFEYWKFWGVDAKNWKSGSAFTYAVLGSSNNNGLKNIITLEKKLTNLVKEHLPELGATIIMQPLSEIYLNPNLRGDFKSGQGNEKYVYIFGIIAMFILVIACINFMNLSTARSSLRAKEIGVRKVIGANKLSIITQFLYEAIISVSNSNR